MAEIIQAWRAWRVAPPLGVGLTPAPSGTLYGALTASGLPWLDGVHVATCLPPTVDRDDARDPIPHAVPGDNCHCGIRGDTELLGLFTYGLAMKLAATALTTVGVQHSMTGDPWRDDVVVIGEVELSGRLRPRRNDDTATTVRAERGRVGRKVFFARPLWPFADSFQRAHPWSTAVRVERLHDLVDQPPIDAARDLVLELFLEMGHA